MAAGVTRTISCAVMVFELTGQLNHLLPVLVAVLAAYGTGNAFNKSYYDTMLELNNYPFFRPPDLTVPSSQAAQDVMDTSLVGLARVCTYLDVHLLLTTSNDSEFAVVDALDSQRLLGTVTRATLARLLDAHMLSGERARRHRMPGLGTILGSRFRHQFRRMPGLGSRCGSMGSLLRGSLANGLSRFLSPSAGVSSVGVSIGVAYEATERARLSSGASDGASDCASHDAVSLEPSADHQTTMHLPDRALREALAGAVSEDGVKVPTCGEEGWRRGEHLHAGAVSEDTLSDTQSPSPTAAAAGDPVAGRTSGGSPSGGGTGNGSRGTGEAEADDDREWRCARGSGVLCGPHAGKSLGERQRQAGVRRAHPSASPSMHMLTTALSPPQIRAHPSAPQPRPACMCSLRRSFPSPHRYPWARCIQSSSSPCFVNPWTSEWKPRTATHAPAPPTGSAAALRARPGSPRFLAVVSCSARRTSARRALRSARCTCSSRCSGSSAPTSRTPGACSASYAAHSSGGDPER